MCVHAYSLDTTGHEINSPLGHEDDKLHLGDAWLGVDFGRDQVEKGLGFETVTDRELLPTRYLSSQPGGKRCVGRMSCLCRITDFFFHLLCDRRDIIDVEGSSPDKMLCQAGLCCLGVALDCYQESYKSAP